MRIIAFGDTILQNSFFEDAEYCKNIKLFNEADIITFNLETVVSSGNLVESEKAVCFRTSELNLKRFADDLKRPVICNIANNHIFDYGSEGLKDTIDALKSSGIVWIGKSRKIEYLSIGNIKLAIIGAYEIDDCPYVEKLEETLVEDVKMASDLADFCILHIHWGRELSIGISSRQREWAHKLVDAGCNIIIGHHPHVIQGIENYRSGIIFYSLGNFQIPVNPYEKLSKYSIVLNIYIDANNGVRYSYIPVIIDDNGLPHFGNKYEKKIVDRIITIANREVMRVTRIRSYYNSSGIYIKESIRAWKIRIQKKERGVYGKIIHWFFTGYTIKSLGFAIIDLLLGYTRKRNRMIWRE